MAWMVSYVRDIGKKKNCCAKNGKVTLKSGYIYGHDVLAICHNFIRSQEKGRSS
jgi:hypothetical protein